MAIKTITSAVTSIKLTVGGEKLGRRVTMLVDILNPAKGWEDLIHVGVRGEIFELLDPMEDKFMADGCGYRSTPEFDSAHMVRITFRDLVTHKEVSDLFGSDEPVWFDEMVFLLHKWALEKRVFYSGNAKSYLELP